MILALRPHSGHLITPGFQNHFQVYAQRVNLDLLALQSFVRFVRKPYERIVIPKFKVGRFFFGRIHARNFGCKGSAPQGRLWG